MTSHGIEYPIPLAGLGQPNQLLVKINPIPAEPRTLFIPYSTLSISCLGSILSNSLPPLFLSLYIYTHTHILPLVYDSSF